MKFEVFTANPNNCSTAYCKGVETVATTFRWDSAPPKAKHLDGLPLDDGTLLQTDLWTTVVEYSATYQGHKQGWNACGTSDPLLRASSEPTRVRYHRLIALTHTSSPVTSYHPLPPFFQPPVGQPVFRVLLLEVLLGWLLSDFLVANGVQWLFNRAWQPVPLRHPVWVGTSHPMRGQIYDRAAYNTKEHHLPRLQHGAGSVRLEQRLGWRRGGRTSSRVRFPRQPQFIYPVIMLD